MGAVVPTGSPPGAASPRVRAVLDVPVDGLAAIGEEARRAIVEDVRWVYGEDQPRDWLDRGTGRDFPTLVRAAHASLAERKLLSDLRVVVLAVTTMDLQHERMLGGLVADTFGVPLTFSVTEQGLAGPFTALRLAHDQLAGAARGATAVVLVLEQCTLPPSGGRVPLRDRAIAIVVGRDGPGRAVEQLTVSREWSTGPDPAVCRSEGSRMVVGAEFDPHDLPLRDADTMLRADPAAATTGVWEVLATLDDPASEARVVLHERCSELGYACSLVLGPRVVCPVERHEEVLA